MTKLIEQLRHGADQAWESLAEGWREMVSRASGALTRFLPGEADHPAHTSFPQVLGQWALMAVDVVDEGDKIVVRLEAPGMRKDDFVVELREGELSIAGEKRMDESLRAGRFQVVQCAYGKFRREVPLPSGVQRDKCQATYKDGVLRIELGKSSDRVQRAIPVAS